MNDKKLFPPTPSFSREVSEFGIPTGKTVVNSSLTSTLTNQMVEVARRAGNIDDVAIALAASGADGTNPLAIEVDVKIDGVSCLSTKPKITYTSGESSQAMSTLKSGEYTDITQAIINHNANSFAENSIITFDATVTRTASPDTEMSGLCVLIKFEPIV